MAFSPHVLMRQSRRYMLNETGVTATHPLATDWVRRVVLNGGATPSNNTVMAVSKFCFSLDADSLTSLMIAVNVIAPDSLIAARTPLIKNNGSDPWANTGFVGGDLTVNGIAGDGASKFLDTGVLGTHYPSDSNAGITLYGYTVSSQVTDYDAGYTNDTGSDHISLKLNEGGNSKTACFDLTAGLVSTATHGAGYYSSNRVAANDLRLFYASASSVHAQIGSTFAGANGTRGAHNMYVCAANHWNAGLAFGFSTNRVSFAAFHQGLSSAQSAKFFADVQALRSALGGGFV